MADDLIRVRPSDSDAHALKARVLLAASGDVDAAWKEATAAVTANRDSASAQYALGLAAMERHDRDAAENAFRQMLALRPPSGPGAQDAGVVAHSPRAGVAANDLAWLLAEDGHYDEALRWAQVAIENLRGHPEPQDTLGWVYLKMDRPADALAAFERASAQRRTSCSSRSTPRRRGRRLPLGDR